MGRAVLRLFVLLALACSLSARAERKVPIRTARNVGAMLGLLSPYPSLIGLTAGWNTNAYCRIELGVGRQNSDLSHVTTWALGVKFFVPHWDLSPWASLNYAAVSHSGPDPVAGFDTSGSHGYGGIGLEWQTQSGFTASVGYNVSTRGSALSQPALQLGWYFSI